MPIASIILAALASAFAQTSSPHYTPGKMALDMNVECVSLLGKDLYRTPERGGVDVKALGRHLAETEKFVGAQPENAATHMEHGRALETLWRYHDAAQAYTRAIALDPADATAYAARGRAFLVLRLFDQAKIDFQHATAIDPANYDAWFGLGLADYFAAHFAQAAASFGKAFNLGADAQQVAQAGELNNIAAARAEKPELAVVQTADVAKFAPDNRMGDYLAALSKRVNDEAGAQADLAKLADSADWTRLGVVAAEAEIAAVEGAKKMRSAR